MFRFIFELTEQQAQKVLNALVKEPYGEVVEVIGIVQRQATEQLNPNPKNDFCAGSSSDDASA